MGQVLEFAKFRSASGAAPAPHAAAGLFSRPDGEVGATITDVIAGDQVAVYHRGNTYHFDNPADLRWEIIADERAILDAHAEQVSRTLWATRKAARLKRLHWLRAARRILQARYRARLWAQVRWACALFLAAPFAIGLMAGAAGYALHLLGVTGR